VSARAHLLGVGHARHPRPGATWDGCGTNHPDRRTNSAQDLSIFAELENATSGVNRAMRRSKLILSALCMIVGCNKSPTAGPPPGGGMPPPEVGVVTLKTESVTLQAELAGRTTASLISDLRPQVSGIIKARLFEEGSRVKAGQVLYQIDPAMYRAVLEEAKADLASAKASLEAARLKDERFAALAKIEGISKQEADDAHAAHELAKTGIAQKQAALEVARINLDYTARYPGGPYVSETAYAIINL